jgi:hypothetical protein
LYAQIFGSPYGIVQTILSLRVSRYERIDYPGACRVAKLQELRQAQEEKASLQAQLQEVLSTLADSKHASQQALQSVQADKQFVSRCGSEFARPAAAPSVRNANK